MLGNVRVPFSLIACKTTVVLDTDAPYTFAMSSTFGGKYAIEKELAIGGCGP
jgi:hypothetical protein